MEKNTEKILILAIDFISINLSGLIYFMLRVKTGWFGMLIMPEMFVPILLIYFYWVVIFTFVGMYRTWFAASRFDEISSLFKASFVGIFILFFAIFLDDFFHGVQTGTRILIFFYWIIFLILVGGGRIFIRSFQRNLLIKGVGRRNALIVGFNQKANEVHDQMLEHRALGIDVKGYVSLKRNSTESSYKNISIIGSIDEIQNLIDKTNSKEIKRI